VKKRIAWITDKKTLGTWIVTKLLIVLVNGEEEVSSSGDNLYDTLNIYFRLTIFKITGLHS